jgi:hypothetical protein
MSSFDLAFMVFCNGVSSTAGWLDMERLQFALGVGASDVPRSISNAEQGVDGNVSVLPGLLNPVIYTRLELRELQNLIEGL